MLSIIDPPEEKKPLAFDRKIRTVCSVLSVIIQLIAVAIVWHFRHGQH